MSNWSDQSALSVISRSRLRVHHSAMVRRRPNPRKAHAEPTWNGNRDHRELVLATAKSDGATGDDANGGTENDVAGVVAVLLEARPAHRARDHVGGKPDLPTELSVQHHRVRKCAGRVSGRKRVAAAVRLCG